MWIAIIGCALWALVTAVSWRLWVIGGNSVTWDSRRRIVWCALLLLAAVLFLRPHEDIFGGQDTGAYLTGSTVFAREGALSYADPLLSQLPEEERSPFVTTKHYSSKYHCLWLPHFPEPTMHTWFQPAYPMMAGVLTHVLPPASVLYVIPLLAILAGLALRALASRLIDHPWAGEAAFLCYVLNPLVVWHARYPRPEVIANLLLVGGVVLLLSAWRKARGATWLDLFLGALCINLAPFFHMSTWMVVITIAVLVVAAVVAGRDDFLLFPLVACATFSLFLYQTFAVTDSYGLDRFVLPLAPHWPALVVIGGALAVLLYGVSWLMRRRRTSATPRPGSRDPRVGTALRFAGGILVLGAFLAVAWLAYRTSADELKQYITRYLWRTDLRCVVEMVSLPTALLGLAGLFVMAVRSGRGTTERWVVLAALVPAALTIGNFYDFFMTRYMLIVIISLLVLGITALITLIPAVGTTGTRVFTMVLVFVCLLGVRNRSLLIRQTQFKGFTRYMAAVADDAKQADAMVLCEYPQIAAPLDLFFGIPTLGLSNERLPDYAAAEKAWEGLMRRNSGKRAFFITPYERPPVSDRFVFVPRDLHEYNGRRIIAHRWALPTEVAEWGCGLRTYEIEPAVLPAGVHRPGTETTCADFGYGNMGLRGFGKPIENRGIKVPCLRLDPERPVTIPSLWSVSGESATELLLLVQADRDPGIRLRHNGNELSCVSLHLINDWWLCRSGLDGVMEQSGGINVRGDTDAFLSMGRCVSEGAVFACFDAEKQPGSELREVAPFNSRWATADSVFLVPATAKDRFLLTFVLAPHEWGDYALVSLKAGVAQEQRRVPTGVFAWELWPIEQEEDGNHVISVATKSLPVQPGAGPDGIETMPVALGYVGSVGQ